MNTFLKVIALVLVSIILHLILQGSNKSFSSFVILTAGCAILVGAVSTLKVILDFLKELRSFGNLDTQLFTIMLKSTGIGLLSEIVVFICNDTNNSALGKAVQLISTVTVLWLSLPLFTSLLELLQEVLNRL